ncbi:hypothetical protein [Christensenella timonensis]|uniref:hypothetical protein n=1 Tax=Christensenella timonensis TaxID=1816678 RepID=UPI0008338DCC|nr:hypothetical protein [Christensenella timonensis]
MKKRWIVLIVAAAVTTAVMAAGTAMAAGPLHAGHRQPVEQQGISQSVTQEPLKASDATSVPSPAPQPTPEATPQPTQDIPVQAYEGCPQHGADCPDDCMWYDGGAGCGFYDESTGTCTEHDGYCRTGGEHSAGAAGSGHHIEDGEHHESESHAVEEHHDESEQHDNGGHHDEGERHHGGRHH